MGFFKGSMTFTRFDASECSPNLFTVEHLDKLRANMIGSQRTAAGDGSQIGWVAGEHVFDTAFDLYKNAVNDCLVFGLRIDQHKVPSELLKGYEAQELAALAASNPSGFASARQKREAKELARERVEQEGKDGRFLRRKLVPVLWDCQRREILIGATSESALDRCLLLLDQTFGFKGARKTSGHVAGEGVTPTLAQDIGWSLTKDFLGNEFLLWLWRYLEVDGDTLTVEDGSEITAMLAKSLKLQCPTGQYGTDTIASDGPCRLPEAMRAIQAGKLPRKAGLILVRHDQQYSFTLQAETMAMGSVKLPPTEEVGDAAREERIAQIRSLLETVDLLYGHFSNLRMGGEWPREVERIQSWLRRERPA